VLPVRPRPFTIEGYISKGVSPIDTIIHYFETYAERVPLELFVFVGTFVEEVFSPIPSFVVLVPAGAVAEAQGVALWYLLVLALLSGAGRVLGALVLYWVGDKLKHVLLTPGRERFGLSRTKVEEAGRRVSNARRGWWVLFGMHAIPVVPIALVGLACGFIRLRLGVFVAATFFGTIINAIVYMSIGYAGIRAAAALQHLEFASQVVLGLLVVAVLVWVMLYRRRSKHRKAAQRSRS
jgi:membrane protein DedA with SNARE-associated domain